jgi:hypothetical protein
MAIGLARSTTRRQRLLERFGPELAPAAWTFDPPSLDLDRLLSCLERLAERERSVVVLSFYADRGAAAVQCAAMVAETGIPSAPVVSPERIAYAQELYKNAAGELAEVRGAARQLVAFMGALVAVEGALLVRLPEDRPWAECAAVFVTLALLSHLYFLRNAVTAAFGAYHWSRPPIALTDGLASSRRWQAIGELGVIEDELRAAQSRCLQDANNLRANIDGLSRASVLSFGFGIGGAALTLAVAYVFPWVYSIWEAFP